MILDCNPYRLNILSMKHYLIINNSMCYKQALAEFSATSMVPIWALYIFYGEEFGFTDDVKNEINRLMKFYDIKEIKGAKNGDL